MSSHVSNLKSVALRRSGPQERQPNQPVRNPRRKLARTMHRQRCPYQKALSNEVPVRCAADSSPLSHLTRAWPPGGACPVRARMMLCWRESSLIQSASNPRSASNNVPGVTYVVANARNLFPISAWRRANHYIADGRSDSGDAPLNDNLTRRKPVLYDPI
jgi:hypothetical protein